MSYRRSDERSDVPVVMPPSRERCNLHGIFLRPDGACSSCERMAEAASSARMIRWLAGATAALVALAITARAVSAVRDARTERAAAAHAKVAAVAQAGGTRVVMYTMTGCGACRAEKAWMASHRVPYVERSIDTDPQARAELHGLVGRGVLPTTVVDEEVLVGFSASALEGALKSHSVL